MRLPSPIRLLVASLGLALSIGCASTVVKPARNGPHDSGIRFYRPKPYLLLQPPDGATTEGYVAMQLMWMPDFGEDYSIHIHSGVGTNNTTVSLANGWQLTQLNSDTDAKVDEFLGAISTLLNTTPALLGAKAGGNGPGEAVAPDDKANKYASQVRAHEVPLGFYEAVINSGPDGKKQLYGWRYVGFSPYAGCPIEAAGSVCQPCGTADLYGLIVVKGEMHFVKLPELAATKTTVVVSTPKK